MPMTVLQISQRCKGGSDLLLVAYVQSQLSYKSSPRLGNSHKPSLLQ